MCTSSALTARTVEWRGTLPTARRTQTELRKANRRMSVRRESLLRSQSQRKWRRLLQCIRSSVRSLAFQYHHRLSIRSESLLRRRLKQLWYFCHRRRLKQLSLVGNRRRKRFWCFTVDTSNANSTSAILWATGNSTSVISSSSFALSTQAVNPKTPSDMVYLIVNGCGNFKRVVIWYNCSARATER